MSIMYPDGLPPHFKVKRKTPEITPDALTIAIATLERIADDNVKWPADDARKSLLEIHNVLNPSNPRVY